MAKPVRILAVLQARMSSTRLPGKMMMPVLGKPLLLLQIERIRRAHLLDELVVATTDHPSDDAVAELCRDNGIPCFRGSMDDVLDRYWQAACPWNPEHIVRLTGDCPLADPELIDRIIATHLEGGYDYTSNTVTPMWPDGLDAEVVRASCLEQAWREAELPSQREHVTPFVKSQPHRFHIHNVSNEADLSAMRWTVDEPEDFAFVRQVYEALYPTNPAFTTSDVLALLAKAPAMAAVNAHHERDAGYRKTLAKDAEFLARSDGK